MGVFKRGKVEHFAVGKCQTDYSFACGGVGFSVFGGPTESPSPEIPKRTNIENFDGLNFLTGDEFSAPNKGQVSKGEAGGIEIPRKLDAEQERQYEEGSERRGQEFFSVGDVVGGCEEDESKKEYRNNECV